VQLKFQRLYTIDIICLWKINQIKKKVKEVFILIGSSADRICICLKNAFELSHYIFASVCFAFSKLQPHQRCYNTIRPGALPPLKFENIKIQFDGNFQANFIDFLLFFFFSFSFLGFLFASCSCSCKLFGSNALHSCCN
jgi:hypothetical protein